MIAGQVERRPICGRFHPQKLSEAIKTAKIRITIVDHINYVR